MGFSVNYFSTEGGFLLFIMPVAMLSIFVPQWGKVV